MSVAHDYPASRLAGYVVGFQRLLDVGKAVPAPGTAISPVAIVVSVPTRTTRVIAHLQPMGMRVEGSERRGENIPFSAEESMTK